MGPWQVSPQKWRLSLLAFLRTWSSLRRSSITCGLHGTKLQMLQSNFNSSLIQFQWQTSLQCHILSCSIYFRDPSDIVCSVWYSNVLWTPCPGTRLQRESWKLRMIWNSSFLQTFSGNLRCMDLTFSKRTKTISRDPYTQSENACFIRLYLCQENSEMRWTTSCTNKLAKNIKNNLRSLNLYSFGWAPHHLSC